MTSTPKNRGLLVSEATGYVGGRLVRLLIENVYAVTCLVRSPEKLTKFSWGDEGSRFVVTIPIEPIGDLVTIELSDNTNEKTVDAGRNKIPNLLTVPVLEAKVLIADDMRDVRFVAQHFLKKAGCRVDVAENGRLAVDAVRRSIKSCLPYDFVLMDVQMPVLDGVGAVKELRESGIEVPIVALTADAMKGTRRQLLTDGFDEYLTKPLNVERLMLVVQSLLQEKRG